MFLLILFFVLGILLVERSFLTHEGLETKTFASENVPVAFPGPQRVTIPPIVQPQNGPLQVQGAVKLGIEGNRYTEVSTANNRATLTFFNNGPQSKIETTGGSGQNDGDVSIQSKRLFIQGGNGPAPLTITGRLDAPRASFSSLKVNREDREPYPPWGPGIHTWDLYANGTIGAGTNGAVNAYISQDGTIWGKHATLGAIKTNSITLGKRDLVKELDSLGNELRNIKINN